MTSRTRDDFDPDLRGHLEAQIANAADELAYSAHDLDDGLRSGLISTAQLKTLKSGNSSLIVWDGKANDLNELDRKRIIRRMIGIEVRDLIESTDKKIKKAASNQLKSCKNFPIM